MMFLSTALLIQRKAFLCQNPNVNAPKLIEITSTLIFSSTIPFKARQTRPLSNESRNGLFTARILYSFAFGAVPLGDIPPRDIPPVKLFISTFPRPTACGATRVPWPGSKTLNVLSLSFGSFEFSLPNVLKPFADVLSHMSSVNARWSE